jgi:probable HAF family extracellular repeat protein
MTSDTQWAIHALTWLALTCPHFTGHVLPGFRIWGTLPNGNTYSIATGLNLLDQAVGSSPFMQPFAGNTHAFLWTGIEGMQDLGTLGCPDITGANDIKLFGQLVGTSVLRRLNPAPAAVKTAHFCGRRATECAIWARYRADLLAWGTLLMCLDKWSVIRIA